MLATAVTALDANGWAIIIGAIFMGILQVLQMVLSHLKGVQQAAIAKEVASKVEQVRINSNGITHRLVETATKEAYARGLLDASTTPKGSE